MISLGAPSSLWTIEAMKKYFDKVDDIRLTDIEVKLGRDGLEVLHEGKHLKNYDCVYIKGSFRFLSLLRSISDQICKKSYTPIKPDAFVIGHDKLLTQLVLQNNNVPMPTTYIPANVEAGKKLFESLSYPIVMKFPQGTQGKGVVFADSVSAAVSVLDALTALNQPFIVQEYIDTGGVDIRAFVVGDRVVAAFKRISKSPELEKRSNIHAGGKGESIDLDSNAKQIAVKAAKAVGAFICGVDILMSPRGPLVIEVNLSPGLQGITAATKIDVADEIAKFLFKKAKERKKSTERVKTDKILNDLGIEEAKTTGAIKEIVGALDFRGNRILLPEVATELTKFKESHDVQISLEKGKLVITHYGPNQEEE